jgi:hypothetical protein
LELVIYAIPKFFFSDDAVCGRFVLIGDEESQKFKSMRGSQLEVYETETKIGRDAGGWMTHTQFPNYKQ